MTVKSRIFYFMIGMLFVALPLLAFQVIPPESQGSTWAQLGIGGVLSGVMFYFYRQDRKITERLTEEVIAAIRNNSSAVAAMTEIVRKFEVD